jgi:hypothetical protein
VVRIGYQKDEDQASHRVPVGEAIGQHSRNVAAELAQYQGDGLVSLTSCLHLPIITVHANKLDRRAPSYRPVRRAALTHQLEASLDIHSHYHPHGGRPKDTPQRRELAILPQDDVREGVQDSEGDISQ